MSIPAEEQDKSLSRRIVDQELSGVLAWAMEACLDWQRHGMQEPAVVLEYGQQYRKNSDLVGEWLAQETDPDGEAVTSIRALFDSYKYWCEQSGLKPMTMRSLSTVLVERGPKHSHDKDNRRPQLTGIRLVQHNLFDHIDNEDADIALLTDDDAGD